MSWGRGHDVGPGALGEPQPGSDQWWREHAGMCDARGAGVTGVVFLDGIGFTLEGAGKLPAGMTITPGGAPAAWLQTDPGTITGYPPGIDGIG